MGGRKRKKVWALPKKFKLPPLDTQFTCPFCNHDAVCEVKFDRDKKVGFISCSVCTEDFQTMIHELSEPVDVYAEWIDACELVNELDEPEGNADGEHSEEGSEVESYQDFGQVNQDSDEDVDQVNRDSEKDVDQANQDSDEDVDQANQTSEEE